MHFQLDEIVEATGAILDMGGSGAGASTLAEAADSAIVGASIDSRATLPGQVFVAVEAERDGHDFVGAAHAAGAAAALVRRHVDVAIPQLIVEDTVSALGRWGTVARGRLRGPVIGITGSVGKTSTKDLLASMCSVAGETTASDRSLNNEMGVPLTLVNSSATTQRTVIEMGARGRGHIAQLCEIARPTIGVVTAVGLAHLELFGSIEEVAAAKAELVVALDTLGVAVLNHEDPQVAAMASLSAGRVITYGHEGDVSAIDVTFDDDLRARFTLESPWGSVPIVLGVRGAHNVSNALAAAAAALVTDVSLEQVAAGLLIADLSPSRMELIHLRSGGIVLNDAYNANPTSMRAALVALAQIDADRKTAVLGLMAELGEQAPELHRSIAAEAAALGIEVVAVGTEWYGVPPLSDVGDALDRLPPPGPGEAVLLKGSRVAQLDRIADEWSRRDRPPR